MGRLVALRAAVVVLLVMGLSGIVVGASLGVALLGRDLPGAGVAIPLGLVGYGLALTAAAIGIVLGRRWGRPVGLIALALGLAILVWILAIEGWDDPVIAGGILIWGVTLGLLIVGAPRRTRQG